MRRLSSFFLFRSWSLPGLSRVSPPRPRQPLLHNSRKKKRPQPIPLRHADALAALSVFAGKPLVWIGAPPSAGHSVSVADTDLVLDDLARAWADVWGVGIAVTPDAIVFRAPGAFRGVTGAHPPVLGTAAAASAAQPRSLAGVRDLLAKAPSTLLARMSTPAEGGGVPLGEVEKTLPGFGTALRKLLQELDTRSSNNAAPIAITNAPAAQLRIVLDAFTEAECFAGPANGKMPLPVTLAPPYATAGPLASAVAPLRTALEKKTPLRPNVVRGTLGPLLRGDRAAAGKENTPPIVDARLEALPITVVFPTDRDAALWPLLGRTVGIERRVLRSVTFFAPTLHDHDYETCLIALRWAAASGATSSISLFETHLLAPFDAASVAGMEVAARAVLRGELERRKRTVWAMPPRFPTAKLLNQADTHDLLEHGRCFFTQTVRLHVVLQKQRSGNASQQRWAFSIR